MEEKTDDKQRRSGIWLVLIAAFVLAGFLLVTQLSLLLGTSWVLSLIGIAWLVGPYCLLVMKGFRRWFWTTLMRRTPDDEEIKEFSQLTASQLERTGQMLVEGLVMLSGVYGILLAFVVSDKASVAFSSWGLLIWIGLVLTIIIHLFLYVPKVMRSGREDTSKSRQNIYYCREFMKLSVIMLTVTVAMVPMFATFPSMTVEQITALPWDSKVGYISVMLCIWCFTAIFWLFMNSENLIGHKGGFWLTVLLPYVVYFIVFSASSSPLSITTIPILGNPITLPSTVMLLIAVLFMFGSPIMLMSFAYYLPKIWKRIRRH